MRIEDITASSLVKVSNDELLNLHHRLHQIYPVIGQKHYEFTKEDVVNFHILVMREMKKRDLTHNSHDQLDKDSEKIAKVMNRLPVDLASSSRERVVVKHFASVVGSAMTRDNHKDIDILIRSDERNFNVEMALARAMGLRKDDAIHFIYSSSGPIEDYLPLYDLCLVRVKDGVINVNDNESNILSLIKAIYEGKNYVKIGFEPMKPSMKFVTEYFSAKELWDKWAKQEIEDGKKIYFEPKLNGLRMLVGKSNGEPFLIYEDTKQNRIDNYPISVKKWIDSIDHDYILDGDVGLREGKNRLSRIASFTLLSKAVDLPQGIDLDFTFFDILKDGDEEYYDTPYTERRDKLREFVGKIGKPEGTANVNVSEQREVDSEKRADVIYAKYAEDPNGDYEGVVAKVGDSKYSKKGGSPDWAKIKSAVEVKTMVTMVEKGKTGMNVYQMALLNDDDRFKSDTLDGKKLYVLGKSMATPIKAKAGDIITVSVLEIMYDNKKPSIALQNPVVMDVDLDREDPYTIKQTVDLAKRSHLIEEPLKRAALHEEETKTEASIKNWDENWKNMLPVSGDVNSFIFQHHWRGLTEEETKQGEEEHKNAKHSVHGDLRFKSGDSLWGFTVFSPDKVVSDGLSRGDMKLPEPVQWLDVAKNKPFVSPPGEVGSTSKAWSKFYEIDRGKYDIGVAKRHFVEVQVRGSKHFNGLWHFIYAKDSDGKRFWITKKQPKDARPFVEHHKMEVEAEQQKEKGRMWMIWGKPFEKKQVVNLTDFKRSYLNFKGKPNFLYSDELFNSVMDELMASKGVVEVFDSGGDITYKLWEAGFTGNLSIAFKSPAVKKIFDLAKKANVEELKSKAASGSIPVKITKEKVSEWNDKTFDDPTMEFYRLFYLNKAPAYTSFPGYSVNPDSAREGRNVIIDNVARFVDFAKKVDVLDVVPDNYDGIYWFNVPGDDYRRRIGLNLEDVLSMFSNMKDGVVIASSDIMDDLKKKGDVEILREYRDTSFAGANILMGVTGSLRGKFGKKEVKRISEVTRVAPIIAGSPHLIIAPVLIPYDVDEYGTWLDAETIETVAHNYMSARNIGNMHERIADGAKLVESYILRKTEKHEYVDDKSEVELPAGTWMIGIQVSDEVYQRVLSGEITGVSIGGWEIG